MRISFELDGTLFVSDQDQAEPAMLNFVEREKVSLLRKGTKLLITTLANRGWEIWIYTNSLRSRTSLWTWAHHLGLPVKDVINQQIHENKCAELGQILMQVPSKMPPWFEIDLHVDDSEAIAETSRNHGFEVCLIKEDDPKWVDKVLAHADSVAARKSRCP